MFPNLTQNETRIVGCLMEKSVVTPEQYPLTLNTLVNACNQKSSRDPVLSLDPGVVQHTAAELHSRHLVTEEENFKSGMRKYRQRFCNTTFSDFQFTPAEFSIVCLLLLRGAQTPGELRARSGRLHEFIDNSAVVTTLQGLVEREEGALVVQLPRTAGRKDSEFMHLLSGPVDLQALAEQTQVRKATASDRPGIAELTERVGNLEAEVAELKQVIGQLQDRMPD
ncbi:MAG: hypothetical protein ACI9FD_004783 [Gammaproteobacteria bacterium]